MIVTHAKYLQFMDGYKKVVEPFEQEYQRLNNLVNDLSTPDEEAEAHEKQIEMNRQHRDIAIAEYAGIPCTPAALHELWKATCGIRTSAYAYMVLDDLPDDYDAD